MHPGLAGRYRAAGTVTTRAIGDELFLMHRDTHATYSLNETSSFIWRLCDGAATGYDILDAVVEHYDVTREESGGTVAELIDMLVREGLLVRAEDHA